MIEWRVVNAADYGFAQRRRRTFIVGELLKTKRAPFDDALTWLVRTGTLARALPAHSGDEGQLRLGIPESLTSFELPPDLLEVSEHFAAEFQNGGVMHRRQVWTTRLHARYSGPRAVLGDVLQSEDDIPDEYFVPDRQLDAWRYLKGAKREERTVARNGFKYFYTEGAVQFPDSPDEPSRTILTGEGGSSPSRFKHVVVTPSGRFRRLTPVELERLNGFPDGWTDTGMPDARRAFCMGNALVVGLVKRVTDELSHRRVGRIADLDTRAV